LGTLRPILAAGRLGPVNRVARVAPRLRRHRVLRQPARFRQHRWGTPLPAPAASSCSPTAPRWLPAGPLRRVHRGHVHHRLDSKQVACPQGAVSRSWTPARSKGTNIILARFAKATSGSTPGGPASRWTGPGQPPAGARSACSRSRLTWPSDFPTGPAGHEERPGVFYIVQDDFRPDLRAKPGPVSRHPASRLRYPR
jgi:hypothetical protein